jgi:hypothetical protein
MLSVGDDVIPQDQDDKATNEACKKLQVFTKMMVPFLAVVMSLMIDNVDQ